MTELETRDMDTSYARQILKGTTDVFIARKVARDRLWSLFALRQCLHDAAISFSRLKPEDLPEALRPDLAVLSGYFHRAGGPNNQFIASIDTLSDEEARHAFDLICKLAWAVGAIELDSKESH